MMALPCSMGSFSGHILFFLSLLLSYSIAELCPSCFFSDGYREDHGERDAGGAIVVFLLRWARGCYRLSSPGRTRRS